MAQQDIGLIGLAVMGENLVLNMESKGFSVAVYNRTVEKVDKFVEGRGKGKKIVGCHSVEELAANLKRPRKVMLLIKAGEAVDAAIEQLLPVLDKGDIIIDGGNSNYNDTIRRTEHVESKGLLYIGTGVSGGEEGALKGPSMMPGGSPDAWPHVKDIFQSVCAKTDAGEPCCDWVGENGAGHFVKMVHNGIEYGDMQMICETYQLMKHGLGMSNDEMHEVFKEWNEGELDSYLIEITRDILAFKAEDGTPMVEKILDAAGQKGTGKWTGINALELGVPVTLIVEAVFARALSSRKQERVRAAQLLSGPARSFSGDKAAFVEDIRKALLASKIISYTQGFMQIAEAAASYNWKINMGGVANMWRGGCIIRSAFLGDIKRAFDKNAELDSLILDDFFHGLIDTCQDSWRRVVAEAALLGIPVPAFATALAFYDGYRTERLPANMIQAQRDYFGAHTYERVDKPRGEFFHTNWTGSGGNVSAGTYNV